MKKIILIAMMSVLAMSTFIYPVAAASEPVDQAEMMEYDGYGKAMYESIVRETTFFTGHYTDNKEYVSQSIDKVTDYAKFWWDEQKIEGDTPEERLKEVFSEMGGYALTVGDWIKGFFDDYDQEKANPPPVSYDDFYSPYFYSKSRTLYANSGYKVQASIGGKTYGPSSSLGLRLLGSGRTSNGVTYWSARLCMGNEICSDFKNNIPDSEFQADNSALGSTNLGGVMGVISKFGGSVIVHKNDIPLDIGTPDRPPDNNYKTINNYVQNMPEGTSMAVPQVRPVLACADGQSIALGISGKTFINKDGSVLQINKDGTATIGDVSCNLSWQQPAMDYINDRPVVQDIDDKWRDMETGELISGQEDDEDDEDDEDVEIPGEGCDSVLCFLSGIGKGIADVVKTIGGLVKKLLDGLLGLFVPDDLDFVTESFDEIKKIFDEKFKPLGILKESFTGIFQDDGTNVLDDFTLDLPILTHPVKLMDMSLVAVGVPLAKKFVSGMLIMFTIMYVYRKITGSGGVMEK